MTTAPKTPSPFSDGLLDQLLAGYSKPEDLTGKDGILKQLTARLVERALQGEMSEHLGYERYDPRGNLLSNLCGWGTRIGGPGDRCLVVAAGQLWGTAECDTPGPYGVGGL